MNNESRIRELKDISDQGGREWWESWSLKHQKDAANPCKSEVGFGCYWLIAYPFLYSVSLHCGYCGYLLYECFNITHICMFCGYNIDLQWDACFTRFKNMCHNTSSLAVSVIKFNLCHLLYIAGKWFEVNVEWRTLHQPFVRHMGCISARMALTSVCGVCSQGHFFHIYLNKQQTQSTWVHVNKKHFASDTCLCGEVICLEAYHLTSSFSPPPLLT